MNHQATLCTDNSQIVPIRDLAMAAVAIPTVLVATDLNQASEVALRRGHALAKILGARLTLLHVAPAPTFLSMLLAQAHQWQSLAVPGATSDALRRTRAWSERVLGAAADNVSIIIKRGHVASVVVDTATDLDAALVVLGDSGAPRGKFFAPTGTIGAVIRGVNAPVLVARPERPHGEIVAATDFSDSDYPALRQAARLGVRLGAHVTFMHNVDASDYLGSASFMGIPFAVPVLPLEPDLGRRRQELEGVARFIGTDIDTVVAMGGSSSDAILDLARKRDADLVVVGARPRTRMADFVSPGTAFAVAREARRSVLTVPLHG